MLVFFCLIFPNRYIRDAHVGTHTHRRREMFDSTRGFRPVLAIRDQPKCIDERVLARTQSAFPLPSSC